MKKRIIMLFAMALLVCTLAAVTSSAETQSGTCGDVNWMLDTETGILTITGTGDMNFNESNWSTTWNAENIEKIYIGYGVNSIPKSAFSNCENLTSIIIPGSLTYIGQNAFNNCNNLHDIRYGGTEVQSTYLTIESGNGILTDTEWLFADMGTCGENISWLLDTASGELTIFGTGSMNEYYYDFARETSIRSVVICNGVTSIGTNAFLGCTSLYRIDLPESMSQIGDYAFSYCSGLFSVHISKNVNIIGERAFARCDNLIQIIVDSDNAVYCSENDMLLSKDKTSLILYPAQKYTLSIPETVTCIEQYAFCNCSTISNVYVSQSVNEIGYCAFECCDRLTTVYYDGTEDEWNDISIASGNDKLKEVTIVFNAPFSSVTEFDGSCGDNLVWTLDTVSGKLIISGTGEMSSWTWPKEEYVPWNDKQSTIKNIIIEDGAASIGDCAFWNCSNLVSITIPASLTNVGKWAFNYCSSLQTVIYCGTKEQWEKVSIGGCNSPLQNASVIFLSGSSCGDNVTWSLDLDTGVLTITGSGNMADYSSTSPAPWKAVRDSIKSVVIEDGVTGVGDSSFDGCGSLASVSIPASVQRISGSAFSGCSNPEISVDPENPNYSSKDGVLFNKDQTQLILCPAGKSGDYVIPSSVTGISPSAFYGCVSLTNIEIPSGVTDIGSSAFYGCVSLKSVTIPAGVTEIEEDTFCGCGELSTVYYGGTEDQWKKLTIGSNNAPLTGAELICNAGIPAIIMVNRDGTIAAADITLNRDSALVLCGAFDSSGRMRAVSLQTISAGTHTCTFSVPADAAEIRIFVLSSTYTPLCTSSTAC